MQTVRLLKPIFKLLTLGVLASWLWVFTIGAVEQPPRLTIKSQPESPLQLSILQIVPSELIGSSVITMVVTNESATTVRAFAVALSEGNSATGVLLINAQHDQQMLRGNEIKPITLRRTDKEIQAGITLSVDYVEFENGNSWGPDTFDSSNSLAGERDGVHHAIAALADRKKNQGVVALSLDLEPTIAAISMPSNHSANWEQGFQRGVSTVRTRLKRALEKGGNEKVLAEWERIVSESKKTTTP